MAKADDTKNMLQIIINGQSAFRQEVLNRINKLDTKFEGKIDSLDKKIDRVEDNLTKRIDALGKQLAYLEDDAPTRDEFNTLEKRVDKLESKPASI